MAQEVERVGWSPEGCQFDPRLLLAEEGRGVPEQDALTLTAPDARWLWARAVDSAVGV